MIFNFFLWVLVEEATNTQFVMVVLKVRMDILFRGFWRLSRTVRKKLVGSKGSPCFLFIVLLDQILSSCSHICTHGGVCNFHFGVCLCVLVCNFIGIGGARLAGVGDGEGEFKVRFVG